MPDRDDHRDEPEGHHRTASRVLVGLGSLGLVLGGSLFVARVDLPMVEATSFIITGGALVVVGILVDRGGSDA